MVKLVHSLYLSSDVEFLNFGVQVYNCGVLFVAAEDQLGFFRPKKRQLVCAYNPVSPFSI